MPASTPAQTPENKPCACDFTCCPHCSHWPEPHPYLDSDDWDRATDPELPPGVVAFKDGEGQWWRYPLVEFED